MTHRSRLDLFKIINNQHIEDEHQQKRHHRLQAGAHKHERLRVERDRTHLLVNIKNLNVVSLAQQRQIGVPLRLNVEARRQIEHIQQKYNCEYEDQYDERPQFDHVLCLYGNLGDDEALERHGRHQPHRNQRERIV